MHGDNGYQMHCGTDPDEDPTWASDHLDVRVFKNNANVITFWDKNGTLIGEANELMVHHKLVDIVIVRPQKGDPGTALCAALFRHPQAAGHVWWKTEDIYDKLQLKSKKEKPGCWFQSKKGAFNTLANQFGLGEPMPIMEISYVDALI